MDAESLVEGCSLVSLRGILATAIGSSNPAIASAGLRAAGLLIVNRYGNMMDDLRSNDLETRRWIVNCSLSPFEPSTIRRRMSRDWLPSLFSISARFLFPWILSRYPAVRRGNEHTVGDCTDDDQWDQREEFGGKDLFGTGSDRRFAVEKGKDTLRGLKIHRRFEEKLNGFSNTWPVWRRVVHEMFSSTFTIVHWPNWRGMWIRVWNHWTISSTCRECFPVEHISTRCWKILLFLFC